MMRRLGKRVCRFTRVGRKEDSALRMVMAGEDEEVVLGAEDGVEGTSPCRFKIIFCFSISAKTG
jgi:hypothetical protein